MLDRIGNAAFLTSQARIRKIKDEDTKFVYYTTAETALSIIQEAEVWMRNSAVMNDYSEIHYGRSLINELLESRHGERLKALLDSVQGRTYASMLQDYELMLMHSQTETYLTCVSEHDATENCLGRLSMWRAYGGDAGVALIFENRVMFAGEPSTNVFASPVEYWSREEALCNFGTTVEALEAERYTFKHVDISQSGKIIAKALFFGALSLKHPGFKEEREWRAIYSPALGRSPIAVKETRSIKGIPQRFYKLRISDLSALDRVIIGPCQFPQTVRLAFIDSLTKQKLSNPANKVVISSIPLRG